MKHLTRTLPLLSVLALAGTAAGVSLGHSAVSEINPLYFGSGPDRFHADLAPQRPNWDAPQPASYPVASQSDGLGDGCFGCGPLSGGRIDAYAAPAVVTYTDSWVAEAERAAAPAPAEAVFAAEAAPDPERERVIRYASYRVSADEVDAASEQEPAPEPAHAETAGETYAAAEVQVD
jgi:hypothetical protein